MVDGDDYLAAQFGFYTTTLGNGKSDAENGYFWRCFKRRFYQNISHRARMWSGRQSRISIVMSRVFMLSDCSYLLQNKKGSSVRPRPYLRHLFQYLKRPCPLLTRSSCSLDFVQRSPSVLSLWHQILSGRQSSRFFFFFLFPLKKFI